MRGRLTSGTRTTPKFTRGLSYSVRNYRPLTVLTGAGGKAATPGSVRVVYIQQSATSFATRRLIDMLIHWHRVVVLRSAAVNY